MTYDPTWQSLSAHETPEWFRDAKFGVWAHWGPQSVARSGDWYARHMYGPHAALADWEVRRPARQYAHHLEHFGSGDDNGYKDLLPLWKAERFDPTELMELYKNSGARFFMSMAVHCDNFALWDSEEQPWNAAAIGPERDIVGAWRDAARTAGLPFGLSFHNNWTWQWLNVAHGVNAETREPNDGRLTAADGEGKWWDGLSPRDLYLDPREPGSPVPPNVVDRFYRMVREAVSAYGPDAVYFDDERLPFDSGSVLEANPPSDAGLRFLADYYNAGGGMVTIKKVSEAENGAVTPDAERRQLPDIAAQPWQFDTSDGEWFDNVGEGDFFHQRKTVREVIHTLVDVVSKNGTLLLNIPQRADGTIDDHARALLDGIGAWLAICGEGIYGTRPWRVYGEGPTALAASRAMNEVSGYNEGELPYTSSDVRYTALGPVVYATLMDRPSSGEVVLRSFTSPNEVQVELLGVGPVPSSRTPEGLRVQLPAESATSHAHMLRLSPLVK